MRRRRLHIPLAWKVVITFRGQGSAGIGMEIQPEAQRVHPGISAAAALDIRACAQHRFQRILKGGRHAAPVGLHLKAAVICAVVGKGK